MAAPEWFLEQNDDAGSLDLNILTEPVDSWQRPLKVSVRTSTGLWYALTPLNNEHGQTATKLDENNTIHPVKLEFEPWARINGGFIEETKLGLWAVKKWLTERRHFASGLVAVQSAVITEGQPLVINGRETGPVDVAWVKKRIDLSTGEISGTGTGQLLESDEVEWTYTKSVAYI